MSRAQLMREIADLPRGDTRRGTAMTLVDVMTEEQVARYGSLEDALRSREEILSELSSGEPTEKTNEGGAISIKLPTSLSFLANEISNVDSVDDISRYTERKLGRQIHIFSASSQRFLAEKLRSGQLKPRSVIIYYDREPLSPGQQEVSIAEFGIKFQCGNLIPASRFESAVTADDKQTFLAGYMQLVDDIAVIYIPFNVYRIGQIDKKAELTLFLYILYKVLEEDFERIRGVALNALAEQLRQKFDLIRMRNEQHLIDAEQLLNTKYIEAAALQESVTILRDNLNRMALRDYSKWAQEITQELEFLRTSGKIAAYSIMTDKIVVETAPVSIEDPKDSSYDYDMGIYTISISYNVSGGAASFLEIVGNHRTQPGYFHPHIRTSGQCCLGSITNEITRLVSEMALPDAVLMLIGYLSSVNTRDCYHQIRNWTEYRRRKDASQNKSVTQSLL